VAQISLDRERLLGVPHIRPHSSRITFRREYARILTHKIFKSVAYGNYDVVACSLLARDVRLDYLCMGKSHPAGNHVGGVLVFIFAEELHQPPTVSHTLIGAGVAQSRYLAPVHNILQLACSFSISSGHMENARCKLGTSCIS
jgi:hypothetical protein